MTDQERYREFLKGLVKLTKKTGLVIDGCGCCGSPWLANLDDSDYAGYACEEDGTYAHSYDGGDHPKLITVKVKK